MTVGAIIVSDASSRLAVNDRGCREISGVFALSFFQSLRTLVPWTICYSWLFRVLLER